VVVVSIGRFRFALALAVTAGCAPTTPAPDTSADEQAIQQVREQEANALSAGDVNALSNVYAPDIHMMPPNEPAVTGMDALRPWVQAMFDQFTASARYTSAELHVAGDYAIERYTADLSFTPKAGGEPMAETIKGIHIYQRQADGSWKIVQDVWNMDKPPASPPPTTTGQ
jgi:uncharacterized protein (TIGR02246 family)